MVKPTGQENLATEKTVCYSQFPRGEACHATPHHEGPHGEALGSVRRQRSHRKWAQEPSPLFLQEGTGKTGLANVNNFKGVWSTGPAPGCPVPGLGGIRAGRQWLRGCEPCESSTKTGDWGMGSGSVITHEGTLPGKSFTISRNWLWGAVSPGSARPRRAKHQKHMVNTLHSSIIIALSILSKNMSYWREKNI